MQLYAVICVNCSLPNVIYLDLKAQMSLGYRVLHYLSYNTYARKAVGYLYAIEVRIILLILLLLSVIFNKSIITSSSMHYC